MSTSLSADTDRRPAEDAELQQEQLSSCVQ